MANKLYALIGPHASGKSTMIKELMKFGVNYIKLSTTKELSTIRSNPELYDGIDKTNFFNQEFLMKITYKNEYYGLLKRDILASMQRYPVSITMTDTTGMKQLSKLLKESVESVYIMVDYVTLVERMMRMGHTNDEVKYHLEYAENNGEFDSWKISNHVVKNVISKDKTLDQILSLMGLMERPSAARLREMTDSAPGL